MTVRTNLPSPDGRLRRIGTVLLAAALLLASAPLTHAQPFTPVPSQPGFEKGRVLPGAAVEYASPIVADLDKDGKSEIIVGGIDGKVYAVRADGGILWTFDTSGPINAMTPLKGKSRIDSAPAVGDLDNDGWPEVVVSVGAPSSVTGYNGGMVVVSHDGKLRPGWPKLGGDQIGTAMGGPDGWAEGFYSSPALADLDGNGDLEIVVGGWDMRYYAWHHDGQLVNGWPRFAYDTVWSSPAVADLDDDGRPEVIIGNDLGRLDVLRGDGSEQPNFPKQIDQTIYSSPAIADLNGDGRLDIVTGTGNFHSGKGMAVYAWDGNGNPLPGWPAATGGYTMGAPSIGDLDADGDPEVVASANDGKVYAFHGNGQPVSGWPVLAEDNFGNHAALYHSSPVLANFDADPQPEVFVNNYCDTIVIDGNGSLLTHVGNSASGKPSMYMFNAWCLGTTPVVADLDGDSRPEIVRAAAQYDANTKVEGSALIYVWERNVKAAAQWPMYRRSPLHDATYQPDQQLSARVVSQNLPPVLGDNESRRVQLTFENTGTQTWTAAAGIHLQAAADNTLMPGRRVDLSGSDSIGPGQRKTFEFEIEAEGQAGYVMSSWRMADGSGRLFGASAWRETKASSEIAYYVLSRAASGSQGGVYAGGLAPQLSLPNGYWNWPEVKDLVLTSDKQGYELLDYQGGVWQGGTATAPGGHGFVPDAVELLMREDDSSYYYILDRYARLVHSSGALDISPAPPVQGAPRARSGVLTKDGKGVYVLLSDGGILTGGTAPGLQGNPHFEGDIARKIRSAPSGAGAYVLDSYGRVWPFGGAPALAANYPLHMNEDWARDLVITADGRGFYVLDKEGGIHTGGCAPAPTRNVTPKWPGQDVAVALAVADSRAPRTLLTSPGEVAVLTTSKQPRTVEMSVAASDQGTVNWRAESNASWARLQTSSGKTPGTIDVNIQPSALGPGEYHAKITVADPSGVYPDTTVMVNLKVVSNLYKSLVPLIMR